MKSDDKNGRKSPYPPYIHSEKYYTDPLNFTDPVYGYEDDEVSEDLTDKKDETSPDEPVESWGWINNVD